MQVNIDAVAGGALIGKNIDEAYELLETMATNDYQWPSARMNQPKAAGINEFNVVTVLAEQMVALTKKDRCFRSVAYSEYGNGM